MTENDSTLKTSGRYLPYFVLSYAHSAMMPGSQEANPDRLVRTFFRHLEDAVRQHASSPSSVIHGFFDQQILPSSDWKRTLSQALERTQVFVALYSVSYFAGSLPRSELACFRRRVERAGLAEPDRRIIPVLWAPMLGGQKPPGLEEALALGAAQPGYVKHGLQAMLKFKSYHDAYRAVVDDVAKEIVELAEESPMDPSEVPDIDEMKRTFVPEASLAVFSIQTAVSAGYETATRNDRGGENDMQWRPFPEQEFPLSHYVRQVIERREFRAEVSGITAVSDLRTSSDPRTRRPGIILIDPWFVAGEDGRSALSAAVDELPRWVLPLLILDRPGDSRVQALAGQVRDILKTSGGLRTVSSREGAQGISNLDDFKAIVPRLVAEAEQQYLRYRSGRVASPRSSRRPRLLGPVRPDEPGSTPDKRGTASDQWGEKPDV